MGVVTGDEGYRNRTIGMGPRLRYPVKPRTGICEKCGDSCEVELATYSINNNRKIGMVCKDCTEEE